MIILESKIPTTTPGSSFYPSALRNRRSARSQRYQRECPGLAGKNALEKNFPDATSTGKFEKNIEKIKNGEKSLAIVNELIKLENVDKHSEALVSKFLVG